MHRRPRLNRVPRPTVPRTAPGPVLTAWPLSACLLSAWLLSACTAASSAPAPLADSPACRAALAAAPTTVLDRGRVAVDGVATLAWGQPPVVARCGLAEPAPTSTSCLTVDGVDWVVDTAADPVTAVTYGRSPAVEIRVPASLGTDVVPAALVDLGPMALALPRTDHACVG